MLAQRAPLQFLGGGMRMAISCSTKSRTLYLYFAVLPVSTMAVVAIRAI